MRYPYDDFPHNWALTAGYGFGAKTDYGYHEALDVNNKLGGNSDLGLPIYAEADGVITSVHNHATNPTFGKHYHLKVEGEWGVRWFHHAHCSEILVKEGDVVKEGQLLAKIGNSGTVYAHDHWACKNQPTGVDGIAKTKEDLSKWEDPYEFVKKWAVVKPQPIPVPQPSGSYISTLEARRRAYKALTGEWVKDEEIKPWEDKGISLDDMMIEVMKGDGRFKNLWITPSLKKIEEDLQKAQTDLKKYIEQEKAKGEEKVLKTYPTEPKTADKTVAIPERVFSGPFIDAINYIKELFQKKH